MAGAKPTTVSGIVDAPRDRVFEFVADLANRPAFTDHFAHRLQLTRIDSSGPGAGARYRLDMPLWSVWVETVIADAAAPSRLTERGHGGRNDRIPVVTIFELAELGEGMTEVTISHWMEPAGSIDRIRLAMPGRAAWERRAWKRALRRLAGLFESGAPVAPRARVAGGNLELTGVP